MAQGKIVWYLVDYEWMQGKQKILSWLPIVFMEEVYYACSLDHEGVKNSDASERKRPISDRCMKGTTYASLG